MKETTLNFIVKNTRTNATVRSFDTSKRALEFVAAHQGDGDYEGPLGPLAAFGLETTTHEFPLVEAQVVPLPTRVVRAGRS